MTEQGQAWVSNNNSLFMYSHHVRTTVHPADWAYYPTLLECYMYVRHGEVHDAEELLVSNDL